VPQAGNEVLGPHVNEWGTFFEVNAKGEIRFGLGAIKGTGDAAWNQSSWTRRHGLNFDFAKLSRSVNKKTLKVGAIRRI